MQRRSSILQLGLPAAIAAVLLIFAVSAFAQDPIRLPGMPWRETSGTDIEATVVSGAATIEGRVFSLNGVHADPEQTLVGYTIRGPKGEPGGLGSSARLILRDGTILPSRWNATEGAAPGTGTLIFPGLPEGTHSATLTIDQLNFAEAEFRREFVVELEIDNRQAFAESVQTTNATKSGEGREAVTVASVSRTPSVIVVRGTFDGLSIEEIQAHDRPDFFLVGADGQRVKSESGRLGFGDDYREFEIRFPAGLSGSANLEFGGFPGNSWSMPVELP